MLSQLLSHSQNEQRDVNTNRSSVRKYYYIDYPIFVNLVKWGIAEMRRNIDDKVRNVCGPVLGSDLTLAYFLPTPFSAVGAGGQGIYLSHL